MIRNRSPGSQRPPIELRSESVRRRRLQQKDRQKALAALARQGFAFDVARRALDAEA